MVFRIEAKLFDPSQPEPTEIYTVFMEVGVGGVYSIYFHQHKTFWVKGFKVIFQLACEIELKRLFLIITVYVL